jgi:hypothetical protein
MPVPENSPHGPESTHLIGGKSLMANRNSGAKGIKEIQALKKTQSACGFVFQRCP